MIIKHLILVGMMGSGKTSTGRYLAHNLNRPHIDLDEYIGQLYQKTIEELITQHTLENFRIIEEQCFNKLLDTTTQPIVISLGGGTYTHKQNFGVAAEHLIFFLKCSTKTLIERLTSQGELNKRPLLKGLESKRLESTINKLLISRLPLYQQSQFQIECDDLTISEISAEIRKLL